MEATHQSSSLPPPSPLTPRRLAALRAIAGHIQARGVSPTYRELGEAIGVSHVAARELALQLAGSGWLRIEPGRFRRMSLLKHPEGVCLACGGKAGA